MLRQQRVQPLQAVQAQGVSGCRVGRMGLALQGQQALKFSFWGMHSPHSASAGKPRWEKCDTDVTHFRSFLAARPSLHHNEDNGF